MIASPCFHAKRLKNHVKFVDILITSFNLNEYAVKVREREKIMNIAYPSKSTNNVRLFASNEECHRTSEQKSVSDCLEIVVFESAVNLLRQA